MKRVRCEVGGGRTCCRNVEKFLCLLGLRIRSFLTHGFVSLGPGKKMSPQRNGTSLRSSWKENKYMKRVSVVGGGSNGGFPLSMIVF